MLEVEVGNFGKAGVGSRKFWKGRSRIFYTRLRNPGVNTRFFSKMLKNVRV